MAATPRSRRVFPDGKIRPDWQTKKNSFTQTINEYFDASADDALNKAKDNEGEDSDYKWLEIIRGLRLGVARMGGIDREHLERQRERARREAMREKQKRKSDAEKKV